MIFTTLFALSCVYNPPFKEIETIKTEKNLLSWICDEGIEIKLDTSSDEGPYLLALKNVFSIDTQNYENNNIGVAKSEASTTPLAQQNVKLLTILQTQIIKSSQLN